MSAEQDLLADIQQQYERRQDMYQSAGGDPQQLQGNLTCYLEYDLLRKVFAGKAAIAGELPPPTHGEAVATLCDCDLCEAVRTEARRP